jgi:hypothetical protein
MAKKMIGVQIMGPGGRSRITPDDFGTYKLDDKWLYVYDKSGNLLWQIAHEITGAVEFLYEGDGIAEKLHLAKE